MVDSKTSVEIVANIATRSIHEALINSIETGWKLVAHQGTIMNFLKDHAKVGDTHPAAIQWAEKKLEEINAALGWVKQIEPEVVDAEPVIDALNPTVGIAVTIAAPVVEEVATVGQEVIAAEETLLKEVTTVTIEQTTPVVTPVTPE